VEWRGFRLIFALLDEEQTPDLSNQDRMIGVLFKLGIATREQLVTITGWTTTQVKGALNRIRRLGSTEKEKDEWVMIWTPKKHQESVYSLGPKGIEYACGLLDEEVGNRRPLTGQIAHFLGINEILCRLIRAGRRPDVWFGTKETASYLYHELTQREFEWDRGERRYVAVKLKTPKLKIIPDAMVQIGDSAYFLEYDTGTENGHKVKAKFQKYFQLRVELGTIPPVIWVTVTETRKNFLLRMWKEAMSEFPENMRFPEMHMFTAGEETAFLLGDGMGDVGGENVKSVAQIELDRFEQAKRRAAELEKQNDELAGKLRKLEREKEEAQRQLEYWKTEYDRMSERYRTLKEEHDAMIEWYRGLSRAYKESQGSALRSALWWLVTRQIRSYLRENPVPDALKRDSG